MSRPRRQRKLGGRLLLYILTVSSIFTILGTGVQLYSDYRTDSAEVMARLELIENSHIAPLRESLWASDLVQIKIQLQGIAELPDIEKVTLKLEGGEVLQRGKVESERYVSKKWDINYDYRGRRLRLGQLRAVAGLDSIIDRLLGRILLILATQAVKTFVVSAFILAIFHYLVTRHLIAMADYVYELQPGEKGPSLALDRHSARSHSDELDELAAALNEMQATLNESYRVLHQQQQRLELEVEERRSAQEALLELNATLEQRVEERTASLGALNAHLESINEDYKVFSYSVSHDLRSSLRSMRSFADMLKMDIEEESWAEAAECATRIQDATRLMAQLLTDLLQLSRVTTTELKLERVNLTDMAQAVLDRLSDGEPSRKVELRVAPNMEARCDRQLMRHALTNLLENSWKYTSKTEEARIEVGVMLKRDLPTFFVDDNGVGFDPAFSKQLFQPFQRLHRDADFPGTGIGLSIVKQVMKRHGGAVWLERAEPDKGTTFCFRV